MIFNYYPSDNYLNLFQQDLNERTRTKIYSFNNLSSLSSSNPSSVLETYKENNYYMQTYIN